MARPERRWSFFAAAGGVGGAGLSLAAAACCTPVLAPLVVSIFGVSGSIWAAGLKPYSWAILTVSGLLVAYGSWTVRRSRPGAQTCSHGPPRWVRAVLWLAAVVWLLALTLNGLQFATARFGG